MELVHPTDSSLDLLVSFSFPFDFAFDVDDAMVQL